MESNITPCRFECEVCDANFNLISSAVQEAFEQSFGNDVREVGKGKWEVDASSSTCHTEASIRIKATNKGYSVWVDCRHSYSMMFWICVLLGLCLWLIGAIIPFLCFNNQKQLMDTKFKKAMNAIEDAVE